MSKKINYILGLTLLLSVLFLGVINASGNYIAPCNLTAGQGENQYDYVVEFNDVLRSDIGVSDAKSNVFNISINPGIYKVTLVASDGYPERINKSQPHEQYYVSFRINTVPVVNSSSTNDLQDNVAQVVLTEIVNEELNLPNGANSIRAYHSQYKNLNTSSANSVAAVCVGLKLIPEEPECGDGTCNGDENCETCSEDCGVCPSEPECGDEIINQQDEECDDGNNNNFDECRNDCTLPFCGDLILDNNEQCEINLDCNDDNIHTLDICNGCECSYENIPYCGDGIKNNNEQCDDGNSISGDGCSATCEIEKTGFCGNGILELGEQCDLGNPLIIPGGKNGFLCWAGYGSSCSYCSIQCKNKTITNYCGDGIKQACEECDDHNNVSGDGCSATCEIEELTITSVCGDGDINQINETCDDGNLINGDGCSASCLVELPENHTCGDGELEPNEGEECDDGNLNNNDGCSSLCQYEEDNNDDNDDNNNNDFTPTSYVYHGSALGFEECVPKWECSGWNECANGFMTRTCYDTRNCEYQYNKPLESTNCAVENTDNVKIPEKRDYSNLMLFIFGILVFIALIFILIMLLRK